MVARGLGFVRRYWLLIALAFIATVLVVVWAQGAKTRKGTGKGLPPPSPQAGLPKVLTPNFAGDPIPPTIPITISVVLPETSVALYKIEPRAINRDGAVAIASVLEFKGLPSIYEDVFFEKQYSWSAEGRSLSITQSPLSVSLSTAERPLGVPISSAPPTESEGISSILSFLEEFGLNNSSLELVPTYARVVGDGRLLDIGLTPVMRQTVTPVVDIYSDSPLLTARVGENGKFSSLVYRAGFSSPQLVASYPAKDIEDIKASIAAEGVIRLLGEPSEAPQAIKPASISITKIAGALFFDPENPKTLFPIFILEGTALTEQPNTRITIYMPAIKSEYLGGF